MKLIVKSKRNVGDFFWFLNKLRFQGKTFSRDLDFCNKVLKGKAQGGGTVLAQFGSVKIICPRA
jgi:hypothetical protein